MDTLRPKQKIGTSVDTPENARTEPTSAVVYPKPPYFLGLFAHNEKIYWRKKAEDFSFGAK